MQEIIEQVVEFLRHIVENSNFFVSIIVGMLIIISESILPFLPLALFIAINMLVFGNLLGFIISWISTIIGCSISFFIFKYLRKYLNKFIEKRKYLLDIMVKIGNIKFSNLVLILSVPFTPAFSVNIGAGLANMSYKKYLAALIISKLFLVYFWGFVGTTFVESITDVGVIIKLCLMVLVAFIVSKFVTKKFDIK